MDKDKDAYLAYSKDKGAYIAYTSIPEGDEDKYEWIQQGKNEKVTMGSGSYYIPKRFYRKKTDAEINKDKEELNKIPAGTIIKNRTVLDTIPKKLHKYINIILEERSPSYGKPRQTKIISAEQYIPSSIDWYIRDYIRNDIPVEISGGRRRETKKTKKARVWRKTKKSNRRRSSKRN